MGRFSSSRWSSVLFLVVISVQQIVGPPAVVKQPPANQTVPEHPDNLEKPEDDLETKYNLEYNRYLKEVVDALESDPEFRRKLETAEEVDFRNGKVANELEYVNHHVRTKLDELKRTELTRLRELMKMQEERNKAEEDPDHHGHLDHSNPHTFEVQDLQMLMNKVRKDLEEVDENRRQEFKEYEMQKEFEKEQKMKEMDEEHKKEYLKELEEEKKKAQHHDPVRPVHHPGSEAQLEEVWEKTDHMSQKFDPKAFFYLHDLDGNGYWDEQEVNALFIKELDKIYAQSPNNHVDMREREEEMERMREHVFKESDTNRDRFISYQEFLEQTKRDEWRRDEGWESIDQKPQFTQKEYEEFEKQRQLEVQRLIDQGVIHPNAVPQYHPPQGMPQYQVPPGQPQYQAHPAAQQQAHPNQAQYQSHPAAGQPQYQAHPPQYQGQPQYQAHPAQQQYHAGQPAYQAHPGAGQPQYQAPPVGQQQYQAHPPVQQQYQGQPAAQQQYNQNQVPQYQQPPVGQQPPQQQQQYQPPQNQGAPAAQTNQVPPASNQVPQGHQAPPQGHQAPPQGHQAPPQGQQAPPQGNQPPQPPSNAVPASQGQPQHTNQVPSQQYNVPDPSKTNEIPHGN